MNVLLSLSLWFVLSTCCGSDESSTTEDYYYDNPTATPDYDYNATFDYYYANCSASGNCFVRVDSGDLDNAAAAIGHLTSLIALGLAVARMCT